MDEKDIIKTYNSGLNAVITLERAVEAIQNITGQAVSEGTLVNVAHSLYGILEFCGNLRAPQYMITGSLIIVSEIVRAQK